MMRNIVRPACLVAALALVSAASLSAEVTLPIRMRAFAVNMSNNLTGANGILQITLDQWSTEEERARLLQTVPKGQDDLIRALQKAPVKGRINIPGWQGPDPQNYRLGWNLRYAWHEPLPDGGDRIVVATDRQMSFRETVNNPRTTDYPFLLIQIHVKDGKGEGKMVPFTQIGFDKKKNTMIIESYGTEPVRLNEITVEKK
jgi:cyanate lyase